MYRHLKTARLGTVGLTLLVIGRNSHRIAAIVGKVVTDVRAILGGIKNGVISSISPVHRDMMRIRVRIAEDDLVIKQGAFVCRRITSDSKQRRVIDRCDLNGDGNRGDRFVPAVVPRNNRKGVHGAVGISRRYPVGMVRRINGVVRQGIPGRGTCCIGANPEYPACRLDHKSFNRTINISFVPLLLKRGIGDFNQFS